MPIISDSKEECLLAIDFYNGELNNLSDESASADDEKVFFGEEGIPQQ